jgi:hypothetical protein
LVLSTIRNPLWAVAYLLVFGMGTVVGMMLMTSAMTIPVAGTGKNFAAAGVYLALFPALSALASGFSSRIRSVSSMAFSGPASIGLRNDWFGNLANPRSVWLFFC